MTNTMHEAGNIPEFTLPDRLAKARSLTGLNSKDFADLIGVSTKTVNNAESGAHGVRKIVMNAWSMATGVPVEWLQTGKAPAETRSPDGGDACGIRDSNPEPAVMRHRRPDLHIRPKLRLVS